MKVFNMGRSSPRHLSVFLGSPSDVAKERNAAREVVMELLDHPLLKGKISIGLLAWTPNSPLEGNADPQQAVVKYVGRPSECDLTVILLSGRLGTPFGPRKPDGSPYRSGAEWEFEDARRAKKPVFLYVRRKPCDPQTDEEHEQRRALADFLADLKDAHLARNDYDSVEEFRALFREHLLRFVSRHMEPSLWWRRVVWGGVAAIAVAAVIYVGMSRYPTLKVDSVVEAYLLTSDPDDPTSPQAVRLLMKPVVDARQGDECFAQASESRSFAGPHRKALEEASDVFEDDFGCERNKWNFLIPLAERPHDGVWRGWVRVALRRGNRIFDSEPVVVEVRTAAEALVPAQRSATR